MEISPVRNCMGKPASSLVALTEKFVSEPWLPVLLLLAKQTPRPHVLLRYSLVTPHEMVHNPLKTGEPFLSLTLPNPDSASVSSGKTQLQFIPLLLESTE